MMNGIAYYPSLMTDYDSNRRWGGTALIHPFEQLLQ